MQYKHHSAASYMARLMHHRQRPWHILLPAEYGWLSADLQVCCSSCCPKSNSLLQAPPPVCICPQDGSWAQSAPHAQHQRCIIQGAASPGNLYSQLACVPAYLCSLLCNCLCNDAVDCNNPVNCDLSLKDIRSGMTFIRLTSEQRYLHDA